MASIAESENFVRFNPSIFAYAKFLFFFLMILPILYLGNIVMVLSSSPFYANDFINVLLVSLFFFVFLILLEYRLSKELVPYTLIIESEQIKFKFLGITFKSVSLNTLYLVEELDGSTIFSSILGTSYYFVLYTLDKKIKIPLRKYKNIGLTDYFATLSYSKTDKVIKYYYGHTRGGKLNLLWSDPSGKLSLFLVGLLLFFYLWGAFSNFIFPPDPLIANAGYLKNPIYQFAFDNRYRNFAVDQPPGANFWLGSDFLGRDLFSRLVYATFYTINIAGLTAILVVSLGLFFGIIAGLSDGVVDTIIVNVANGLYLIPPFAIWMFATSFSGGLRNKIPGGFFIQTFLVLALIMWGSPSKVIRQEIKSIKNEEFILVQRTMGSSGFRIFRKHILPNLFPVIILLLITSLVDFVVIAVTISVLLGLESTLMWGSDIGYRLDPAFYKQTIYDLVVLDSTIWITLALFGLLLFTDVLKDVLDPRFRTVNKQEDNFIVREIFVEPSEQELESLGKTNERSPSL